MSSSMASVCHASYWDCINPSVWAQACCWSFHLSSTSSSPSSTRFRLANQAERKWTLRTTTKCHWPMQMGGPVLMETRFRKVGSCWQTTFWERWHSSLSTYSCSRISQCISCLGPKRWTRKSKPKDMWRYSLGPTWPFLSWSKESILTSFWTNLS